MTIVANKAYLGGFRCIAFPNGTRKEIRPANGVAGEAEGRQEHTETVYFSNGDIKQVRAVFTGFERISTAHKMRCENGVTSGARNFECACDHTGRCLVG